MVFDNPCSIGFGAKESARDFAVGDFWVFGVLVDYEEF